jgi:drug/metabolite transporter (DMT)-like permease
VRRSAKQLAVVGVILAIVGVAAALAGTIIVLLTGSEEITPIAGGLLGAALGVSAGTVIGRVMRRRRTILDLLMQVIIAGGLAGLTLWFLQRS